MKTIVFASLIAATATAAANPGPTPNPAPPPPPLPGRAILPACQPGGAVVFEIDHATMPEVAPEAFPTSEAKLYANGTWSIVERSKGKVTRQESGCIDSRIWGAVDKMIAAAPWHQTVNDIHCAALSATHVVYSARGRQLFDDQMCATSLDAVSRAHLDDATALLDALTTLPEPMRSGRGKP